MQFNTTFHNIVLAISNISISNLDKSNLNKVVVSLLSFAAPSLFERFGCSPEILKGSVRYSTQAGFIQAIYLLPRKTI